MADKKAASSEKALYCSFCGKSQHEVKKLIAGPSVFICDECIELCNDIIRDELPPTTVGAAACLPFGNQGNRVSRITACGINHFITWCRDRKTHM